MLLDLVTLRSFSKESGKAYDALRIQAHRLKIKPLQTIGNTHLYKREDLQILLKDRRRKNNTN